MNECYHCGFWDEDYCVCTCPVWDLLYLCPKSCIIEAKEDQVEGTEE